MEVRNRISIEVLVTVEASKARGNPLNSLTKNNSMQYDTDRVNTFSKFLSEEWDLDVLALYLHNRDILQSNFGVKFREIAMQGIRTPDDLFDYPQKLRDIVQTQLKAKDSYGADTLLKPVLPPVPSSNHHESRPLSANLSWSPQPEEGPYLIRSESVGTYFDKNPSAEAISKKRKKRKTLKPLYCTETKEKVVPIALPPTLYFIADAGLPEAPSVSFHSRTLPLCCELVLPKCSMKVRKRLSARVLLGIRKRLEAVAPLQPGGPRLSLSEDDLLVPFSILLYTICEEWRLMPQELREKFGSVGQAAIGLEKLNNIYAENNTALKERLEEIRQTEMMLSQCKATIITLQKKIRRLERRWKQNRKHATDEELENLQKIRLAVTEEEARK